MIDPVHVDAKLRGGDRRSRCRGPRPNQMVPLPVVVRGGGLFPENQTVGVNRGKWLSRRAANRCADVSGRSNSLPDGHLKLPT